MDFSIFKQFVHVFWADQEMAFYVYPELPGTSSTDLHFISSPHKTYDLCSSSTYTHLYLSHPLQNYIAFVEVFLVGPDHPLEHVSDSYQNLFVWVIVLDYVGSEEEQGAEFYWVEIF